VEFVALFKCYEIIKALEKLCILPTLKLLPYRLFPSLLQKYTIYYFYIFKNL